MNDRQSYLLSPYRLPTSYPLQLVAEETAAWLNGYAVLWHPAAIIGTTKPPTIAATYDHDTPAPAAIYAVPKGPHLYQPDDWANRVREASATLFHPTADRAETMALALAAVNPLGESNALAQLPEEIVRHFTGLGLGYLLVDTIYEAMDHDRLLDKDSFWGDVTAAVAALLRSEDYLGHLKAAAEKLLTAREQVYSGSIYWLDWAVISGAAPWPSGLLAGQPVTVLASAESLEELAAHSPDRLTDLRTAVAAGTADIACGSYRDREDAMLPFESQWWNLRAARQVTKAVLGAEPSVYARMKSAFHPQLPGWLRQTGYRNAVLVSFDAALIPSLRSTSVNWPSPDGQAVEAFTRIPLPADDPQTAFNLGYHIHQAISLDAAPAIALIHHDKPAFAAYADLLALGTLAPVLGTPITLSKYLTDAVTGDYVGARTPDEFFADYLDDRVTVQHRPDPVSGFARQLRLRRRLDSAYTLAALHRSLTPSPAPAAETETLAKLSLLEHTLETQGVNLEPTAGSDLIPLEADIADRLAARIQARSHPGMPGLMVFNPCSFTRRTALERDDIAGLIPVEGPVKAADFVNGVARVVVEVPPLGFAWIPRSPAPTSAPKPRLKLAEGNVLRNEFLEVDIDVATGGLRAVRDLRTRLNRFGQQLVFNPGSKMRARSVTVTASGLALGEITTEGDIVDEHDTLLATFRQRFRTWLGRPVLEMRIDLDVHHQPTGYAWHAYYGSRFGWRDDRGVLFRGSNGANTQTGYTRPIAPDYLEVRLGSERSFLFTGGLGFVQRHSSRMADVILVPEGEQTRTFDLLISLDRDQPMQTALGWVSPTPVVVTDRGPPAMGTSGWLAHVDQPGLILTGLRQCQPSPSMNRAVSGRFVECSGFAGAAELRFARDPARAALVDGMGVELKDLEIVGDAVRTDYSAGEMTEVKVEWV